MALLQLSPEQPTLFEKAGLSNNYPELRAQAFLKKEGLRRCFSASCRQFSGKLWERHTVREDIFIKPCKQKCLNQISERWLCTRPCEMSAPFIKKVRAAGTCFEDIISNKAEFDGEGRLHIKPFHAAWI